MLPVKVKPSVARFCAMVVRTALSIIRWYHKSGKCTTVQFLHRRFEKRCCELRLMRRNRQDLVIVHIEDCNGMRFYNMEIICTETVSEKINV